MNSLHATPHATRLVLGTLAALALLAATSAVAASARPSPATSSRPAGRRTRKPLINMGISAASSDRDKWYVPAILPRGDYVLVQRKGDKARGDRRLPVHGHGAATPTSTCS